MVEEPTGGLFSKEGLVGTVLVDYEGQVWSVSFPFFPNKNSKRKIFFQNVGPHHCGQILFLTGLDGLFHVIFSSITLSLYDLFIKK